MFKYLVSSPARRRLLEVLWLENASGSASALALAAVTSFASAYRELHAMRRYELVTTTVSAGFTVFAANAAHPLADALRSIVGFRYAPSPPRADSILRAQLADLGAPVGSEAHQADVPAVVDLEATIVAGAELCRREPSTARAFPVLLHYQAARLDFDRLRALARASHIHHALGFLLALTGKLAHDHHLTRLASSFRDRRVRAQPFFYRPPRERPYPATGFPLAYRWGVRLNMDEAIFAKTFYQFTTAAFMKRHGVDNRRTAPRPRLRGSRASRRPR